MSDISLKLDGLVAFLVAGLIAFGLFLALVITAIWLSIKRQPPLDPARRQSVVYRIVGMSISLVFPLAVMLIVITFDGQAEIPGLAPWLDQNLLIWGSLTLAPIPISIYAAKRRFR